MELVIAPSLAVLLLYFAGAWFGILTLLAIGGTFEVDQYKEPKLLAPLIRRKLPQVILLSLLCTLSLYTAQHVDDDTITPVSESPQSHHGRHEDTRIAEAVAPAPSPEPVEEPMPEPPHVGNQ